MTLLFLLLLSIALHEGAHAAAAWFFRVRVKGIFCAWFGVGIVRENVSGWRGAAIAMAGPLASLVLAIVCTGFARNFNQALFFVSLLPIGCSDLSHAWKALRSHPESFAEVSCQSFLR